MMFKRFLRMDDESVDVDDDKGEISLVASTDDAVRMGAWSEVLSHKDGAVDMTAARALLVNHNPDQIAGKLDLCSVDGRACMATAKVSKDARMQSGVTVLDAVRDGSLRGVSVGYTYAREDAEWDKETRTLTVHRWRLLEISLTPIPADAAASVRSLPFVCGSDSQKTTQAEQGQGDTRMSDVENAPEQPGPDMAAIENAKREASEHAKREAREVVQYARSYDIDADAVVGMSMPEAKDYILQTVAERMKKEHAVPTEKNAPISVQRDSADKFIEHATENFSRYSAEDLIRRCFSFDGKRHEDMSKSDLAQRAVAGLFYSRDAANKTNASFPVLLGNIANKQLLNGFDSFSPVWNQFCTVKEAADFKEHSHVAVATGRMSDTPENEAFPELNQKEGSYNSALKLYGATVSITYQALVNDELAEIMRSFRQAGYIAARTIERRVFQALLAATWTNDTTDSATLATAGNIDKVRAGLKGKLSPAGEKMENDARIIIVDPANRYNAEVATGQLYGVSAGGNAMGGSNHGRGIQVVDSTFVSDTSLTGGALTTDYYLVNDPNIVDTIVVEFLRGQQAPQIAEFDAGAVAASKYKIMLPFQATIATHTDSAGNARITGIQKATVA